MRGDTILTKETAQLLQNMSGGREMLLWVIYQSPSDYPGRFVARPHNALEQRVLTAILIANTLNELRTKVPAGLALLAREPNDDPVIIETWV
jgi:hypothetical protein